MTAILKLKTTDDFTGVALPEKMVRRLQNGADKRIYAVETPNGIELTPYDPEYVRQMEAAKAIMQEDHEVLRKLAE